jgi:hypothetical protein
VNWPEVSFSVEKSTAALARVDAAAKEMASRS